jgi:phage terminase large subunit-like protein
MEVIEKKTTISKKWLDIIQTIPGYDPLKNAEDCHFDRKKAYYYIEFIETCCTHIEGALAGETFRMEKWERAIIANLFGWYREDFLGRTVRRYRKCVIFVPRKNGKTPMAAAIHNAIFFLDDEVGQVNNLAAASRDQATKLFRWISGMIRNEPEMRKLCQQYSASRSITKPDNSVTKVIPADEKVAWGDNQHFSAIDELHAQSNRKLYDAMITAMASANRIQPLILFVTTSDYDRPSICNEEYDYACKVRDSVIDDQTYLPVIYEAMHLNEAGRLVEDDWTKEETWYKANPNLGISVSLDYLRGECKKAKENPAYENTFKRLHLNIRTEQAERIIAMKDWDSCEDMIDWAYFHGKLCWCGLDIGAIRDFVSLIILFGDEVGEAVTIEYEDVKGQKQEWKFIRRDYWLKHYCWLPESPRKRDSRMESQIQAWTKQNYIIRTPGNVVDYDQVGADITRFVRPYSLQVLAIDQGFQGMQITQDLQKIYGEERVVAFRQGIISMAAPFRELMQLLSLKRLHHDGDPVMRWMASNVASESRGGLTKPSKDKSTEKIDGITALTMAIGVAMTAEGPKKSVYEEHGIRSLE